MNFCQETRQKNSVFEFDMSGVIGWVRCSHFVRSHSNVRVDGIFYFLLSAVFFLFNCLSLYFFLSRYSRISHDNRMSKTESLDLTLHHCDSYSLLSSPAFVYLFQSLNKLLNLNVVLHSGKYCVVFLAKIVLTRISIKFFRSIRGSPYGALAHI